MPFKKLQSVLCLFAAALLSSCGSPGVPLPPSLEVAKPVTDLRVARKGDKVYLTWTAPTVTTDRHNIQHPGATEVCRSVSSTMPECGTPIAKVPPVKVSESRSTNKTQATFIDDHPAMLPSANPVSNFIYAISVLNSYGRTAGLSNKVQVPAAPTLTPPSDFHAELTADGVMLTWRPFPSPPEIPGLRFVYRIYRRQPATNKDAIAGEVPVVEETPVSLLDHSFEWEKTYAYRATVVTQIVAADGEQRVEGDDTPPVTVVAHDVFPPATPTGLQAVFSGPGQKSFIDLVWTPNSESDLAGYNIYRHEQGTELTKLNSELVKAPAFRDAQVLSGHQYSYLITAADVRGNESPHSEEASETVP
ncbi:MAG: hypothetical protein DMG97_03720 [Acidobacteria bacterium]|nr:MAG: hypothetical protein DMG97_03720 [Acidobacteriota bacterium]